MGEVDYIGKKSVLDVIKLSKLCKFIVFQSGATKGSTPVFRCTDTKTIEKARQAFEDWADSVLRTNPNNNRAYELLLFSAKSDDADIDDEVEEALDKGGDKGTKRDKIRFTFSLNPYNNFAGMGGYSGVNVQDEIKRGIEEYKLRDQLLRLERRLHELENEEEEEEEEHESALDKVYKVIEAIRKGEKPVQFSGDSVPDPDDDDDADVVEKKEPVQKSAKDIRNERLKIALHRIQKLDPEWKAIYKLSILAKKQPTMFNNYMQTLMNMTL